MKNKRKLIEFWEPVYLKEFRDYYEVSTLGRVRRTKAGMGAQIGKVLSGSPNTHGYTTYNLYNGRKGRLQISGHKLVSRTFLGECPIGKEVNHEDGNKTRNWFTNLEYVTHKENLIHALKSGLRFMPKGESHWISKLSEGDVRRIKRYLLSQKYSYIELAKMFDVCRNTVVNIASGRIWRHIK